MALPHPWCSLRTQALRRVTQRRDSSHFLLLHRVPPALDGTIRDTQNCIPHIPPASLRNSWICANERFLLDFRVAHMPGVTSQARQVKRNGGLDTGRDMEIGSHWTNKTRLLCLM
jgi:hypothetical protein